LAKIIYRSDFKRVKAIDLLGQKFGRLTVLSRSQNSEQGKTQWTCLCECGNQKTVLGDSLRSNKTTSCGCYRKQVVGKNAPIKHGKTHTRLFRIWSGMKSRCYAKTNNSYKNYGYRGIVICDEWRYNFQNFYKWAMTNGYADNLTIDRTNVNGNYEPANCKWATYQQQENNRRDTVFLNICGCRKPITEWSEMVGIGSATIEWRIRKHWPFEQLFISPNLNNKNIRRK
jgi:hypothetical protein